MWLPNQRGYLRQWLVAGPKETPYTGLPLPEHVMRREALDYSRAKPPATAAIGQPSPFGGTWEFHYPGGNDFVEFSTFYRNLCVVEYWAFTEIVVSAAGERSARFWAAGAADLWVNDKHVTQLNVTRSRNADCMDLTLSLQKGVNRLCVRLQCLGLRDSRILFGLSLAKTTGVRIVLPGAQPIANATKWLDSVRGDGNAGLISQKPAPSPALAELCDGRTLHWPKAATALSFRDPKPFSVELKITACGQLLRRAFEFTGNRAAPDVPARNRRTAHLESIARSETDGGPPPSWNSVALPLLARRLLGRTAPEDARYLTDALTIVDKRQDCADFVLAALLRLEWLGLTTPLESLEISRATLGFRYWLDEPGSDAMCFQSENHTLLFRGCQLLAGRRHPSARFTNSGRLGKEHARLARPHILAWIEKIEARGFEEFNSGTYMPITIGAMLNIIDFGGDAELSARLSALVDRIYRDLATHAFGGGIISPQGRVYRDVLTPDEAGTQVLLALATPAVAVKLTGDRLCDWAVFPASSPHYQPPADLTKLVAAPVSKIYRHAEFQILLEKTRSSLLTSLAVPATRDDGSPVEHGLQPGGAGYQQHLWQATLGRDCHVFVNHPGGTFDETKSRPGYWYGNGLLPRVRQRQNKLQAIYVIADGRWTHPEITPEIWSWARTHSVRPYHIHPVPFVHAHWPSDAFDRELRRGGWLFGQKGSGFIGLWCSEPLTPHDDILTGRELRAESFASAWMVICGDKEAHGSFTAFMKMCEKHAPKFDERTFTLMTTGEPPLQWWERPEPIPT